MQLVKYGVVSLSDALRDLWQWDSLYLAGRMHKPTREIVQPDCKCLEEAMLSNRRAAAAAAMLALPPQVSQDDVLSTIVGLSYAGMPPTAALPRTGLSPSLAAHMAHRDTAWLANQ